MSNQDNYIRVTTDVKERLESLRDNHHSPYEPVGLMVERLLAAYDHESDDH